MSQATVAIEDESLTGADIKLATYDEFHEAEILSVNFASHSDPEDGLYTPTDSVKNADVLLLRVKHPNGENELLRSNLSGSVDSDLVSLSEGDTVWVADWEDIMGSNHLIHDEKALAASRTKIDTGQSIRRREKNVFWGVNLGAVTLTTGLALFSGVSMTSPGLLLLNVLALMIVFFPMVFFLKFYLTTPYLKSRVEDSASLNHSEETSSDTVELVSDLVSDNAPVEAEITHVDEASGEVECELVDGRSLVIEFESPRQWSTDYEMIQLVESLGVGDTSQLEGEYIGLQYDSQKADVSTTNRLGVVVEKDDGFTF